MADILVSYARTDRKRVAPIVALLEATGWSVQYDPAGEDGDASAPERESAPAGCVVAAWSIDSVDSAAVLDAASRGLTRGVLISVSIDFSRPPRELEQAPSIVLAGWTGDATSPKAGELLTAVGDLLARGGTRAPTQPAPTEPAEVVDADAPPAAGQPAVVEGEPPGDRTPEALPKPHVYPEPAERLPEPTPEEEAAEPVWAFPDEPEDEDFASRRLPPVLLRERGQHPMPPAMQADAGRTPIARRFVAVAAVAGVMIVAAAGALWMMEWLGGPTPGGEAAAVETAPAPSARPVATAPARSQETKPQAAKPPESQTPQSKLQESKIRQAKTKEAKTQEAKPREIQPTPAALPKEVEIEDLLGQVTPRVEQLLADARRLIAIGDIRGAREVLGAPETAHSGSLTFLLAETYDPNILPAALKSALADPRRAGALYRKARDLGDGRAQARLDWLTAN
jgi:hypothetical protein